MKTAVSLVAIEMAACLRGEERGENTVLLPQTERICLILKRLPLNTRLLFENYRSYLKNSLTMSSRGHGRRHRCNLYACPMYNIIFMAV